MNLKLKLNHAPESIWQNPWHFIAAGFGSGAMPIIPGTFGTLMAIPFYLLMKDFSFQLYLVITIIFCIFSMYLSDKVAKEINVHDHPGMNIDEFAGFFATMLFVPATPYYIIAGFILFRIFDILKPFPINWIDQHVHGGFGIVLDDIVAGIVSGLVLVVFKLW